MTPKFPIRAYDSEGNSAVVSSLLVDSIGPNGEIDLTGSSPTTSSRQVLRFDKTKNNHVDHGAFWNVGDNYEECYWDMLVRPLESGYIISAGYGPDHNLLLGFEVTGDYCGVTGNMFIDDVLTTFSSPVRIPTGSWNHLAVVWDKSNISIWINGCIEAVIAAPGDFRTANSPQDVVLFVGGSDHSNISADIAWIRGFENQIPTDQLASSAPFRVQQFPRVSFNNSGTIVLADFCADYTRPSGVIADVSPGLLVDTQRVLHPGVLGQGIDYGDFLNASIKFYVSDPADLPQWVDADIAQWEPPSSVVVPAGARLYDSFTTKQKTPFWTETQGLGEIEGGSLGIQTWSGSSQYWISYGAAVAGAIGPGATLLDNQSEDIDLYIEWTGNLSWYTNYVDDDNYLAGSITAGSMYFVKKVSGVVTNLVEGAIVPASGLLRMVKSGTGVTIYVDGEEEATATASGITAGTKCGFEVTSFGLGRVTLFATY
jgi:hypothetical protein